MIMKPKKKTPITVKGVVPVFDNYPTLDYI
jgi:hypothetical protein